MSLRKRYQWVKRTSKDWHGVSRHFRTNVQVFGRGVVRAHSSHLRKIAGVAVDVLTVSADAYSAFWLARSR
jgi:hypothetical protein